MKNLIDLDFGDARTVILIAEALDTGHLNPNAPTTTARQVAAVVYGASPSRANVLTTGDLLDKLGAHVRGHGAYPHARAMTAVEAGVRAHEEQARGRQANPTRVEVILLAASNRGGESESVCVKGAEIMGHRGGVIVYHCRDDRPQ